MTTDETVIAFLRRLALSTDPLVRAWAIEALAGQEEARDEADICDLSRTFTVADFEVYRDK